MWRGEAFRAYGDYHLHHQEEVGESAVHTVKTCGVDKPNIDDSAEEGEDSVSGEYWHCIFGMNKILHS